MNKQTKQHEQVDESVDSTPERHDLWHEIDAIETEYADLIETLEADDRTKDSQPKMKVTGASTREIPKIQARRREKK